MLTTQQLQNFYSRTFLQNFYFRTFLQNFYLTEPFCRT